MLQGTASDVGKSILTAALCRIFMQAGWQVAPFKAQNMALNSYITADGLEMGRAQVFQAKAAGLKPIVEMNPVLLKPLGNARSQVILAGRAVGNMSARDYHLHYCEKAFLEVKKALSKLSAEYQLLILEGAGSPAEVNLQAHDIVNMRVARHLQAPVILVADIDRGGALAAIVGTLELLSLADRELVKGIVINKFRGDVSLFQPAIDFLEAKTHKPVLGVIPYLENLQIDEEDSVAIAKKKSTSSAVDKLLIAVVRLPHMANFTDFDALEYENDVELVYAEDGFAWEKADVIILPGSKNTIGDRFYLRERGLDKKFNQLLAKGKPFVGICGGYQLLGERIIDRVGFESDCPEIDGLGFLPQKTDFQAEKLAAQVEAEVQEFSFLGQVFPQQKVQGYEIHAGKTSCLSQGAPFVIVRENGNVCQRPDGAISADGLVLGTYLHGIFDNDAFRRQFLNALRHLRGWTPLRCSESKASRDERELNRLAEMVKKHLNMEKIMEILEE